MHATPEQIAALIKLQQADLDIARMQRELDELPQKRGIFEARQKKAALAEKRLAALRLKEGALARLSQMEDEDGEASRRIGEAASDVASSVSDFRSAEAAGKELAAAASHREELSAELDRLIATMEEADSLIAKIDAAASALDERERELTRAYRASGGELLNSIARVKAERETLEEAAGLEVSAAYGRIAAAKGGVAVALLNGASCTTCRATFDEGRALKLRSEAPLTTCPSCGRLMVVDKRYGG